MKECDAILRSFQENKSPRNDGIPIEFYRKCWTLISEPFLQCINDSFEKGEMRNVKYTKTLNILTERKGKDCCFIENWRPISLLSVDAKIMSKVIATITKNVLPNIQNISN